MNGNIKEKFELLQHLNRVSELSMKVARELGLSEEECMEISIAGHLHDVGKIVLMPEILNKSEKLTKEELKYVQSHVIYSSMMTQVFKNRLSENIVMYISQHHESADGSGYPEKLQGADIALGSHIIKICDVYDAMTSERPYSKRMTGEQALSEIFKYAQQFDLRCIKALMRVENLNLCRDKSWEIMNVGELEDERKHLMALMAMDDEMAVTHELALKKIDNMIFQKKSKGMKCAGSL